MSEALFRKQQEYRKKRVQQQERTSFKIQLFTFLIPIAAAALFGVITGFWWVSALAAFGVLLFIATGGAFYSDARGAWGSGANDVSGGE